MVPRELQVLIAPQAYGLSGVLAVLALGLFLWGAPLWGVVALALGAGNLAFFRNPSRTAPAGEGRVLSPADGRVVEVVRLESPDPFVGPAWRVAIFLSIFNVHIQRAPLSGKVCAVRNSGTRFLAAFNPQASSRNVQTRLEIEAPEGGRIGVVQITGLIARRIVCYAAEGGTLVRGEPYGLICYGSRLELILPADTQIMVQPGDRVKAGETEMGELPA